MDGQVDPGDRVEVVRVIRYLAICNWQSSPCWWLTSDMSRRVGSRCFRLCGGTVARCTGGKYGVTRRVT